MSKEKYKIYYETDDELKVYKCEEMDEVLYMLLNIKIKKWSLVKIKNIYK
jgi:hypothetical protein